MFEVAQCRFVFVECQTNAQYTLIFHLYMISYCNIPRMHVALTSDGVNVVYVVHELCGEDDFIKHRNTAPHQTCVPTLKTHIYGSQVNSHDVDPSSCVKSMLSSTMFQAPPNAVDFFHIVIRFITNRKQAFFCIY